MLTMSGGVLTQPAALCARGISQTAAFCCGLCARILPKCGIGFPGCILRGGCCLGSFNVGDMH